MDLPREFLGTGVTETGVKNNGSDSDHRVTDTPLYRCVRSESERGAPDNRSRRWTIAGDEKCRERAVPGPRTPVHDVRSVMAKVVSARTDPRDEAGGSNTSNTSIEGCVCCVTRKLEEEKRKKSRIDV